jgi:DHA2 family methylenomycin A resistance protein-like MFS transporter
MSLVVGIGSLASGRLTAPRPRPPMLAGFALDAAGAAVVATAGSGNATGGRRRRLDPARPTSLAMPAMTAVVVGAAGPEHAGVASGILNTARQSGGALGVALLGSLLGSSASASGGAPSLHVPLAAAAAGYLAALALACLAIRPRPREPHPSEP